MRGWILLWATVVAVLFSPRFFEREPYDPWAKKAHAQEATQSPGPPDLPTATPSATPSESATSTAPSASETPTDTATAVTTSTGTPTPTEAVTETPSPTASPTTTASPTPTATPVVETIIDATGGSLASIDGHITLSFPPNATDEPLRVRVETKETFDAPLLEASDLLTVWQFDAFAINRGDAPVSQFAEEITIEVTYTSDDLFGKREDMIRWWTFDDMNEAWVESPVTVVDDYQWRVSLDHFSTQATSSDGVITMPIILDQAQVNLNAGAATFGFPIDVAPGVGGLEPSVGLSYSSARVDESATFTPASWVGNGWDLSMPSITKQGSDKYFLNMAGAGGEIVPKDGVADKWVLRDEQFLEITHDADCDDETATEGGASTFKSSFACAWTIRDQSGRTYVFGGTADSRRYYHTLLSNPLLWRHYQWDLSSVEDFHGNEATYTYTQQFATPSSMGSWTAWVVSSYPAAIEYAGGRVEFSMRSESTTLTDWKTDSGGSFYVRPDVPACRSSSAQTFESRALASVTAKTWETDAYEQFKRYEFTLDTSVSSGCGYGQLDRLRLLSVATRGRDDGVLTTSEFAYTDMTAKTRNTFCLSPQNDLSGPRLTTIKNGFGGQAVFAYTEQTVCEGHSGHRSRFIPQSKTVKGGSSWTAMSPDIVTEYEFDDGPVWDNGQYRGYQLAREIDADSNTTVHTFLVGTESGITNVDELAGREVETQIFDAEDELWHEVVNEYESVTLNNGTAFHNRLEQTTQTVAYKDDTKQSRTTYTYDSSTGRVTEVKSDGDISSGSNVDCRIAKTAYYAPPSGLTIVVPKSSKVTKCDNTVVSETVNYFDGAYVTTSGGEPSHGVLSDSSGRGNLTAVRRLRDVSMSDVNGKYVFEFYEYHENGTLKAQSVPFYGNSVSIPGNVPVEGEVATDKGRTVFEYEDASADRFIESAMTYVYDPDGDPAAVPTQLATYTYDANSRRLGKPIQVESPNGLISGSEYDEFGRPTKQWTSPDSQSYPTTAYEYTWTGGAGGDTGGLNYVKTKHRLTANASTTVDEWACFNGGGRQIQHIGGYGTPTTRAMTRTQYDDRGLPMNTQTGAILGSWACTTGATGTLGPNNLVTYDPTGNVLTATNVYDETPSACDPTCVTTERLGRTTAVIDAEGHRKETDVDGLGRVVATRDYTGVDESWTEYSETTYEYDVLDNLTKVTDELGNDTVITYDNLGRKTSMIDPDMSGSVASPTAWLYDYDAAGNLTYQRDARLVETDLTYDSLNRLHTKSYTVPSGSACDEEDLERGVLFEFACVHDPGDVTYVYDEYEDEGFCEEADPDSAIGRLVIMDDGSGITRWCYDLRGNEIAKRQTIEFDECSSGTTSRTMDMFRTYDSANRVTSLMYPDSFSGYRDKLTYTYNDTTNEAGALETVTSTIYQSDGETVVSSTNLVTAATYHQTGAVASITFGNSYVTTYTRDDRYRLSGIATGNGSATPQDVDYAYYEDGNIQRVNDVAASDDVYYTYDEMDRLTGMWLGDPEASGTQIGTYTYGDTGAIGNLTEIEQPGGTGVTLTYGDEDHVHAPDTGGGGYTYDANGNLAVKEYAELFTFDAENRLAQNRWYSAFELQDNHLYNGHGERVRVRMWSDTWGVGDTHDLFMDGIYEESGLHCATASNNVRYYTAFGRIIAQRRTLSNGSSTLLYFMADHIGSTVGTLDASSGSVSTIKYWPFGKVRSGNVSTSRRFTGQRWEQSATSTMDAYFYNARFYSPKTAHFMSADPVSGKGDQYLNRYSYATNRPLDLVDPTGTMPICGGCHDDSVQVGTRCVSGPPQGGCALTEPIFDHPIAELVPYIQILAWHFKIDSGLILAIFIHESGSNPHKRRIEDFAVLLMELSLAGGGSAQDGVAGIIDDIAEFNYGPGNVRLGLAKQIERSGLLPNTGSDIATIRLLRTTEGALKYVAAALRYLDDTVLAPFTENSGKIDHQAALYNVGSGDYLHYNYTHPGQLGPIGSSYWRQISNRMDEARSLIDYCAIRRVECSGTTP